VLQYYYFISQIDQYLMWRFLGEVEPSETSMTS